MGSHYGSPVGVFVGFAGRRAGSGCPGSRRTLVAFLLLLTVGGGVPPDAAADIIVGGNTPHLSFTASLTPDVVRPGGKMTLIVNITPKRRMNVYAPGNTKYRPLAVTLNRNGWLKPGKTVYPKPSIYLFKPFKEQVLVFSDKLTMTTPIAIGTIPAQMKEVKILGTLSYQACDDRVCYLPQSVPLEWVIPVRR